MRVICGHTGWVRAVAVDSSNEWFATGAADRLIKIWDLASGELMLSLTGHVSTVRALAVSPRHPYLFSAAEDKSVKCWDLEVNKVVRHYHGHLSAVYAMALHPRLDVLATGGRDAAVRLWDMRSRVCIHTLMPAHDSTVAAIVAQSPEYQLISASMDSTVRLWDLRMGRSLVTLTHHKKGVRALALSPSASLGAATFVSASADAVKQWVALPLSDREFPDIRLVLNYQRDNQSQAQSHQQRDGSYARSKIINTIACNPDGVLAAGCDDGTMRFWDYRSGRSFQRAKAPIQPGSLDAEAGVFALAFDRTGSRLISCEADKTIKVWGQVDRNVEQQDM